MEIGPLHNKIPITDIMNQSESNKKKNRTESLRQQDSVIISKEARAKLAELADKALEAELKAKQVRLEEVKKRVENGFYDSPRVKEIIADYLIDDLE